MKKNDDDYHAKHGHYNPVKAKENGWPIRLSKSSFMNYLSCPRKFWWTYVEMEGIRLPATSFMIHGTAVHKSLENLYGNLMDDKKLLKGDLRPLFDNDPDDKEHVPYEHEAVDILADLEAMRLESWGEEHYVPIEFEVKHEVLDPDLGVILVGMIDGLLRHPVTGDLVIVELKTGKLGKIKQTKTRKELAYYAHLLELIGYGKTSHFMYFYPECTNEEILLDLLEREAKSNAKEAGSNPVVPNYEVWVGDSQGVAYIEPFMKRTATAFTKSLYTVVDNLKLLEWPMKWNEYFCTQWCDYAMSCETELMDAGWKQDEYGGYNDE